MEERETTMKELRAKAAHLLIREEWQQSSEAYTRFISLCQQKLSLLLIDDEKEEEDHRSLTKSLCNAFSCRGQAFLHLHLLPQALSDCNSALNLNNSHFSSLLCKAQALLRLHLYSAASASLSAALLHSRRPCPTLVSDLLSRSKLLESQSSSGTYDISAWILHGFSTKPPHLAQYVGSVEIRRSEGKGIGLFAVKNMGVGTVILATEAVAIERAILPRTAEENLQLLVWKRLISKVRESLSRCTRTRRLFKTLNWGEEEKEGGGVDGVPEISMFMPGVEGGEEEEEEEVEMKRVVGVLDVNSRVEDRVTGTVLGKKGELYGVGLWLLPSLLNHSCAPNSRRLHVGDHLILHASAPIRAGEEITEAYFDVLCPLERRRELCMSWGFSCRCERCRVEEEEGVMPEMKKRMRGVKERGYAMASLWGGAFSEVCSGGDDEVRRRRRARAAEEVAAAVGGDERVLRMVVDGINKGGGGVGFGEMERVVKMGRGVYGNVMTKKALLHLLGFTNPQTLV